MFQGVSKALAVLKLPEFVVEGDGTKIQISAVDTSDKTKDTFVTYDGQVWRSPRIARFKGVEETLEYWAKLNGCPPMPVTVEVPREADDGLVIKRLTYGPGREGSEAILYAIEGGGHTWPGRKPFGEFLGVGKSALDLKANDLIWEFFQKHPMP